MAFDGLLQHKGGKIAHGAPLPKTQLPQILIDRPRNGDRDPLRLAQSIAASMLSPEISLAHDWKDLL